MQDNNLAIVIPAYKSEYLCKALESIANQTCKNFTLYIGEDNSPNNLYEIVKKFESSVDIVYKRFDENLGGTDLVAQWERCIDMVQKEEWIWLFSDDDLMSPDCVEKFYKSLNATNEGFDIYRFNVNTFKGDRSCILSHNLFDGVVDSSDFLYYRLLYKYPSFAVEYVFNRRYFEDQGGFVKFPKAWCSDDATWYKLSRDKGFYTIKDSLVFWRYSESNISGNTQKNSNDLIDATQLYTQWLINNVSRSFLFKILLYNWFEKQIRIITKSPKKNYITQYSNITLIRYQWLFISIAKIFYPFTKYLNLSFLIKQ